MATLPDDDIVCFITDSEIGVEGVSYSFAFEAMMFGYPETYVYSGDSSPIYGWLPALGATNEAWFAKSKLQTDSPILLKIPYSINTEALELGIPILPPVIRDDLPKVSICEGCAQLAFRSVPVRKSEEVREVVVYREKPSQPSVKTGSPAYTEEPLYKLTKLMSKEPYVNNVANLFWRISELVKEGLD